MVVKSDGLGPDHRLDRLNPRAPSDPKKNLKLGTNSRKGRIDILSLKHAIHVYFISSCYSPLDAIAIFFPHLYTLSDALNLTKSIDFQISSLTSQLNTTINYGIVRSSLSSNQVIVDIISNSFYLISFAFFHVLDYVDVRFIFL